MRKQALATAMLALSTCATSMTPSQFLEKLPNATQSTLYNPTEASEALSSRVCKVLVAGRSYTAPVGMTVNDDLENGAEGIDEWVQIDGGNAFTLTGYEWTTVDEWGTTQLVVHFDTMLCG